MVRPVTLSLWNVNSDHGLAGAEGPAGTPT
jgi:hypothetical protein